MEFSLQITMDGAAFDGDGDAPWRPELARLLRHASHQIEEGWDVNRVIVDVNGNRVGQMGVTP